MDGAPRRRAPRSSAERRAQRRRAEGRALAKILEAADALDSHRGCSCPRLLRALATALGPLPRAPPQPSPPQPDAAFPALEVPLGSPLRAEAPVFVPYRADEELPQLVEEAGTHEDEDEYEDECKYEYEYEDTHELPPSPPPAASASAEEDEARADRPAARSHSPAASHGAATVSTQTRSNTQSLPGFRVAPRGVSQTMQEYDEGERLQAFAEAVRHYAEHYGIEGTFMPSPVVATDGSSSDAESSHAASSTGEESSSFATPL